MRYGLASAMATIAVMLTFIAGPGWFAKQTLYDTDTVVERVETALEDERVHLAIGDKVTDELFLMAGIDRDQANDAIDEATDDEPSDDEPDESGDPTPTPDQDISDLLNDLPIAEALQTVARDQAVEIVASGRLTPALVAAVRESHTQFLEVAESERSPTDEGQITIDLDPVVDATLAAIADDPLLGFLSTSEVNVGEATFIVARDGQGGGVWWTVLRSFPDWSNLAVFGTFALLGAAIVLSPERDRIMLSSGAAIAGIALIIAAGTWAARAIVSTVFIRDEVTRGAFEAIYDTLSKPLISLEIRIAAFAAGLAVIGGIVGFVLDWRAERALVVADATDEFASQSAAPYQTPYGNTGIPPGPTRDS